jgi:hypothetical protein
MAKFRWHRGSLDESMATVMEIESYWHLKRIIEKSYSQYYPDPDIDVIIEPYGYDDRIGWDSYIVRARILGRGKSKYSVEGFTDCMLSHEEPYPKKEKEDATVKSTWIHGATPEYAVLGNAPVWADCTKTEFIKKSEDGSFPFDGMMADGPRDHTQGPQASLITLEAWPESQMGESSIRLDIGDENPFPLLRKSADGKRASYRIHNDMLKADMIYERPLMRDCIEGCGKTFRIIDETEFRCDTCKEKIRKMQLRVEAGNAVLDACEMVK